MKLADVTDPMVPALLALRRMLDGESSDDDVLLVEKFGWVHVDDSEISDRVCWSITGCDETGKRILEEAQRIAEGLTPAQLRALSEAVRAGAYYPEKAGGWRVASALVSRRLIRRPSFAIKHVALPAGRLVLALQERR